MYEIVMKKQNLNEPAEYFKIHDGAYGNSPYKIISGEFDLKINGTSTLKFTVTALHPYFHVIKPFESFIYVNKDNTPFFCGRVFTVEMYTQVIENNLGFFMDVVVESAEAFLNDIIETKGEIKRNDFGVYPNCMAGFINAYNAEAGVAGGVNVDFKKITLGEIDDSLGGTKHRLIQQKDDSFKTALAELQKKIDGFWWVTFDDNHKYFLHYKAARSDKVLYAKMGQNIVNMKLKFSEVQYNKVTIKSEEVSSTQIFDDYGGDNINHPGRIDGVKNDERFSIQESVDSYAEKEAREFGIPTKTIELEMIDKNQEPELGALLQVDNPIFQVNAEYRILGISFKLSEPWKYKLTLNKLQLDYFQTIQEFMRERRWEHVTVTVDPVQ